MYTFLLSIGENHSIIFFQTQLSSVFFSHTFIYLFLLFIIYFIFQYFFDLSLILEMKPVAVDSTAVIFDLILIRRKNSCMNTFLFSAEICSIRIPQNESSAKIPHFKYVIRLTMFILI